MTVTYQGEQRAFTEVAAGTEFPNARLVGRARMKDVLASILDGTTERAVLPVETSGAGSFHETMQAVADLGEQGRITIIGERWMQTQPVLLAGRGVDLPSVTRVISHPHALAESAEILRQHLPAVEWIEEVSTATAARRVAADGGKDAAALASREAAELYGLRALEAPFLDSHSWQTRYLVIGPAETRVEGADRTTLVITPSTKAPNAFFRALTAIVGRRLAIHRVELLPRPGHPGAYRYMVDVEGDASRDPLGAAIKDARAFCDTLAVAGSYQARPPR